MSTAKLTPIVVMKISVHLVKFLYVTLRVRIWCTIHAPKTITPVFFKGSNSNWYF